MPTVEDLPRDIRDRIPGIAQVPGVVPRERPDGKSFIGGKATEYSAPQAKPAERPVAPEEPVPKEVKTPCQRCGVETESKQSFCSACGLDFKRKRATEELGITIDKEMVEQYIFTGYLTAAVKLFGEHVATFKSLQSDDVEKADEIVRLHFKDADSTVTEWQNYRAKVLLAFGWAKLDGVTTGKDFEEKFAWIQKRGAHFVDLASKKYALLSQAISEVLNGDTLKNS
jgi:ribosomal protein L37E